jgi:hypothetical protein
MAEAERSFTAVPKPEAGDSRARETIARRIWSEFPDGALGIVFLLLLSSFCGGLIAVYWPFNQTAGEASLGDRISTIESKVDAMAIGRAPGAAAQVFIAQRREISALKSRLDADEARLAMMEKSESAAEAVDVTALKSSADRTEADVKQIADRVARAEQGRGAVETQAMRDRLTRFEQRIAALEKSAPPADFAQRLDSFALKSEEGALETRIVELESQDMSGVMRRAAAVMALADLVRASAGGEPFADELSSLKALAPASPELQDLAHYAAKGVPTRTMLAESFSRQIDTILGNDRSGGTHSWSGQMWSGVMNVVTMRPIRNIIGNDPQARVARAQVDLNVGELARAVREINALPSPAREAAEPWLKSANERITVDRDAHQLAQRLVASLSVQSGGAQAAVAAVPAK